MSTATRANIAGRIARAFATDNPGELGVMQALSRALIEGRTVRPDDAVIGWHTTRGTASLVAGDLRRGGYTINADKKHATDPNVTYRAVADPDGNPIPQQDRGWLDELIEQRRRPRSRVVPQVVEQQHEQQQQRVDFLRPAPDVPVLGSILRVQATSETDGTALLALAALDGHVWFARLVDPDDAHT